MKRVSISFVILLLIAGLCVFATLRFSSLQVSLNEALQNAQQAAEQGDADQAGAQLEQATERWNAERGVLHFLLDRDELAGFDLSLKTAKSALATGELPDFAMECAKAGVLLEELFTSELPTWQNLL